MTTVTAVTPQTNITVSVPVTTTTNQTIYIATVGASTGTSLMVTTVTSGALVVGQSVFINGAVNTISAVGNGTGGIGTYLLASPTTINSASNVFASYVVTNTQPPKYAPVNKTMSANLSQLKWNINWKENLETDRANADCVYE